MSRRISFVRGALGALLLALASAASPAPVPASRNATGTASVLRPLTILRQADMDFGALVVNGAGTAVINPVTSTLSTTGGLTIIGTSAHPAVFTTTGSRNSIVLIRIPQNPITLTRVGGAETMTVSSWTLDGPTNRRIPPNTGFNFAVGATVAVAAGQVDGTYTGTFAVTVQYP